MKKMMLALVSGIILLGSLSLGASTASAAPETYRLSVYSKVNSNDGSGPFTFEYFENEQFHTMTNYVETANVNQNYWANDAGNVIIKGWTMSATSLAYGAVAFHAPGDGYVDLSNLKNLSSRHEPSFEAGQLMIVQKSDRGYNPVFPVKDSWEYFDIPKRIAAGDTDTPVAQSPSRTYVKEGDIIYFMLRGNEISEKPTSIDSEFVVEFTSATVDTEQLYPNRWTPFRGHTAVKITEPLAILSPDGNEQVMRFKQDRPVFKDRFNAIFKHIPDSFENKSFMFTDIWGESVGWESSATVEQAGAVYILASNAKRTAYAERGYTQLPNKPFNLFWGGNSGDRAYVFTKSVAVGEKVPLLDRYGIIVFGELNESDYDEHPSYQTTLIYEAPHSQFAKEDRTWQGVASIAQTADDVVWVNWASGADHEVAAGNYNIFARSTDGGDTFTEMFYFAPPHPTVKVLDVTPWTAPDGKLWVFYAQGRGPGDNYQGVWAVHTDNPNDVNPQWSTPQWISLGIVRNKPTVLSNGDWLLPVYDMLDPDITNVLASTDEGESWYLRGSAKVTEALVDEPMIVEKQDGSLWMLIRSTASYGIAQSFSYDQGRTWTDGEDSQLQGPGARFHITRLQSGNLLLVNHHNFTGRNNLTAFLSEDDGQTWPYQLLLDERDLVTYPDSDQDSSGLITVAYDRDRYGAREVYTTSFTESDIKAGQYESPSARQKHLVDKLQIAAEPWEEDIGWYIQQNQNPFSSSYFTFSYLTSTTFNKMESFQEASPSYWQSESALAGIQGWQVWANGNESPVIKFHSGRPGVLTLTDNSALKATSGAGNYMIVQQNEEGGFYPLYPEPGEWTYQPITSVDHPLPEVKTYIGDKDSVYIVYQKSGSEMMTITSTARAKFEETDTDTAGLRPGSWTYWNGAEQSDQEIADQFSALLLSAASEITQADNDSIEQLRAAYEALTSEQQQLVSRYELLTAAEYKLERLAAGDNTVAYVIQKISAIPADWIPHEVNAVVEAVAAYRVLTLTEQAAVTNSELLLTAELELAVYQTDRAAAMEVERFIDLIPRGLTLMNRQFVSNADNAYQALTPAQQALVFNAIYLIAAKEKFALMDGGQNVSVDVVNKIALIPSEITLEAEPIVTRAAASYDLLTASEKNGVSNYSKLEDALAALAELKREEEEEPNAPEQTFRIQSPVFTNFAGQVITSLTGQSFVRASVSLANETGQEQSAILIVALYDGSQSLKNISFVEKEVAAGQSEAIHAGFSLPANTQGYSVKIFVWDSLAGMQPLSEAVQFPQG